MTTAKQYLFEQGKIDAIKKGRISLVNHEWLTDQVENHGVVLSDYKPKHVVNAQGEKRIKNDAPTNVGEKTLVEPMPYLHPEGEFKAIEYRNGKSVERSMRSACNMCRASLVVCACEQPLIVAFDGSGSVPVRIVRL